MTDTALSQTRPNPTQGPGTVTHGEIPIFRVTVVRRTTSTCRRVFAVPAVAAVSVSLASNISAQRGGTTDDAAPLRQLNRSIQALVTRVSPSVVQIIATGYGAREGSGTNAELVLVRQRVLGSGVVVDSDGYIITNAHVVSGARRIQVLMAGPSIHASPTETLVNANGTTADARIVGVDRDTDLALLKVQVTGLPAIRLADHDKIRQGEIVFAFGSPEGLRDSVTMGW